MTLDCSTRLNFNDDFNIVYLACERFGASKWENLAIRLSVPRSAVLTIKEDEQDSDARLKSLLTYWLRAGQGSGLDLPSWCVLIRALAYIDRVLSNEIAKNHQCHWHTCVSGSSTAGDSRTSLVAISDCPQNEGDKLKREFIELLKFMIGEMKYIDVLFLRLEINEYFRDEESIISDKVEQHLKDIEEYSAPCKILDHLVRYNFIGYINYNLITAFQKAIKSPMLMKHIEEYEKKYKHFLEHSFMDIRLVFERCPDLHPKYPVGIPKFKVHLESAIWDKKTIFDLKDFLRYYCDIDQQDLNRLMIAKIEKNCIIITFAIPANIGQKIAKRFSDKDIGILLKNHGVYRVIFSQEILQYQSPNNNTETVLKSLYHCSFCQKIEISSIQSDDTGFIEDAESYTKCETNTISEDSDLRKKQVESDSTDDKINYSPCLGKEHLLSVFVENQSFPVAKVPMVPSLINNEKWITAINHLDRPFHIDARNGFIVVSEYYGQCVSVFNKNGDLVIAFGAYGEGPGKFRGPSGIGITEDNHIIVVDKNNCRVQKFTIKGEFIEAIGKEGKMPLQFSLFTCGLSVHPRTGKIYVCDVDNHRIQVINSDFTFSHEFGSFGMNQGEMHRPHDVAFDHEFVYVVDKQNFRVQIFTFEGDYHAEFGGPKFFKSAEGIAVDIEKGIVYVSDSVQHNVSLFKTGSGEFIKAIGKYGNKGELGTFNQPSGMAVNDEGTLFICDRNNKRLQIL